MKNETKARVFSALSVPLFLLATFTLLWPLAFIADFLRRGDTWVDVLKLLGMMSVMPIIFFSLAMICRNNAKDAVAASNKTQEGIAEELGKPSE